LSGQFLRRSLFAAVDAIPGAMSRHTHTENVMSQLKYGQIINCGLTILIVSLFSLCRLRIMTQLRSGAVDILAGIFTKRIWQPYMCQPNELKREIKKKTGGAKRGAKQKSWEPWPTQAPLESPLTTLPLAITPNEFLQRGGHHLFHMLNKFCRKLVFSATG